MQDYIKVPFELDISKNVEFDTVENAVATIKNAVKMQSGFLIHSTWLCL